MKWGLSFGIIDFWVVTRSMARSIDIALVLGLLKFLANDMRPLLFSLEVWLWILGNSFEQEEATSFAKKHMKQ